MENAKTILEQAINGVLQEKALSKEAIDAVQQILAENVALKQNDENTNKALNVSLEENRKLVTENIALKAESKSVSDREKAVAEREKKADLLDLTVQYEKIRVGDAQRFIETIFRNTIIRKNVTTSVPVINNGYQNGTASGSENHQTSEE